MAAGALLLVGCGADGDDNTGTEPPVEECLAPNRVVADGRCVAPGVQDSGCSAGELTLEDGTCLAAGVPPELCAEGFEPLGDGCEPILPETPCPAGQLALPGETVCHDVAPCGAGTWGDIPVESTTQYVNQAYPGSDSDGSAEKPWTSIAAGVATAAPGALVAIAAGTYAEDVLVAGKAVRLWGVCPAHVEITGAGGVFALAISDGAHGSEIHHLAVRSVGQGVGITGATDVVLAELWVHDGAARAIDVEETLGPASASIRNCLIENNRELGIYVSGSEISVEGTVVRGTLPRLPEQTFGAGLWAEVNGSSQRAQITVRHSVVEANHDTGIMLAGSDGVVEGVVVRGTLPCNEDQLRPGGVQALDSAAQGMHSTLALRSSVLDGNSNLGVHLFGSEAVIEGVMIRNTSPRPLDMNFGHGLHAEEDLDLAQRSIVTMRSSTIAHNHGIGVFLSGTDATIESTTVRDTLPQAADSVLGRGISVRNGEAAVGPSNVTIRGSLVERNHDVGILAIGSVATIEATAVRDTQPQAANQLFGRGIGVQMQFDGAIAASATVRTCLLERNHDVGLFFGAADSIVEDTAVLETLARAADGHYGRGINAQSSPNGDTSPQTTVRRSLVDHSRDIGVMIHSGRATLEQIVVRNTLSREVGGLFGDGITVVTEGPPAFAELLGCSVASNARAGVATFGGEVLLADSRLDCNTLNLVCEQQGGSMGQVTDGAGNRCGCGDLDEQCQALSANLEPPQPVDE